MLAEVLAWPIVACITIFLYRDVVRSLLPGAKIKLAFPPVIVEATIPMIEQSVADSLRGEKLTGEHWSWLKRLRDEGPLSVSDADKPVLRLLRDAGLLRTVEKGFLQSAKSVEITRLWMFVVDAYDRKLGG
jgi:hypothetical protein